MGSSKPRVQVARLRRRKASIRSTYRSSFDLGKEERSPGGGGQVAVDSIDTSNRYQGQPPP